MSEAPVIEPTIEPTPIEVAPETYTMDNWKDILPEDTREWDRVKTAKTPKDLMDSFGYFMNKAGKSISMPGENSSVEEREAFVNKLRDGVPELLDMPLMDDIEGMSNLYSRIGKPDDISGYTVPEFDLVDGVSMQEQQIEAFKNVALKHNLTKAQFDGVMNDYIGESLKGANAERTAFNQDMQSLRDEWGQAFDNKRDKAVRVAEQFFPNSGLKEAIDSGMIGAGTLRDFEALASQLGSEGQQIVGQPGANGANTPQELREEAETLMNRILETPPGVTRDNLLKKRIKLLQVANS